MGCVEGVYIYNKCSSTHLRFSVDDSELTFCVDDLLANLSLFRDDHLMNLSLFRAAGGIGLSFKDLMQSVTIIS